MTTTAIDVVEAQGTGSGTNSSRPRVVLVHGAMDRHNSFRRLSRRIANPSIMYDRRGYASSLHVIPPAKDLERHVADLIDVIGRTPAVVVGHSVGGLIALTAAAHFPGQILSVAAFEPPTGWKHWWPEDQCVLKGETPEQTVERFYRQMVGDSAWNRLTDVLRSELLAEGPALQLDLQAGRQAAPFEQSDLVVPVLLGHGGVSAEHHIRAVQELADDIAATRTIVIEAAAHGAHRSHPDAFAALVESTVALA